MSEFIPASPNINVRSVDPSMIADQREQKAVLAMQATALLGSDEFDSTNARLMEAAQDLGVAPAMTYEDLIFVNPLERGAYVLSTDPNVAEQEALFYGGHRRVEIDLAVAIESLQLGDYNAAPEYIQSAGKSLGRLYKQLDPEAFTTFRPYFVGINNHPGPSGLFSAAIPLLDLLSHGGRNMSQDERERLLEHTELGLYPSHQSMLLKDLLLSEDPQLEMPHATEDRVVVLLNRFRSVHSGSVRKFAPQVLDTEAEGSGGIKNVGTYLASKVISVGTELNMTKVGIGLPGITVADVRASAEAASEYAFDSFSVYGDLGDLPPYAVLHASAELLRNSNIPHVGPMGIPAGLLHPEAIASHAVALEQQLPNQSYVGLVRGAFLEQIGEKPASLQRIEETVAHLRMRLEDQGIDPRIYLGGFGPRILKLAGLMEVDGVKLGGSVNPALAKTARAGIGNNEVQIVLGAVSVIDKDRRAARQLARQEVAKYLAIVGALDPTLSGDEQESLKLFKKQFSAGNEEAYMAISDNLLDKFAIAGNVDDAFAVVESMNGIVDRLEFGTPHGLGDRPSAIRYIGESIIKELEV